MATPQSEDRPFTPPLEGGDDWLSFYPCPYPSRREIAPWFNRFAEMRMVDVRELLRREWRDIQPPALKAFSETLLRYYPCGLLHSAHKDLGDNAWVVISETAPSERLSQAMVDREVWPSVLYLAAPYAGPMPSQFDPNDLLQNFFLRFGGLRLSPPFCSGCFYHFPEPPIEIEPGELDRLQDTEWSHAQTVYVSGTGNQLVLTSERRIGWLLHDPRGVVPVTSTFEDLLNKVAAGIYLDAYD